MRLFGEWFSNMALANQRKGVINYLGRMYRTVHLLGGSFARTAKVSLYNRSYGSWLDGCYSISFSVDELHRFSELCFRALNESIALFIARLEN